MNEAHSSYEESLDESLSFDEWQKHMETMYPQFFYWSRTLDIELLFLQFLKSQREANFLLYTETLTGILPLLFTTDHFHYARWLSVHLADMQQLQDKCPSIHTEFMNGNFVTQKTKKRFSALAHDQIHEQLNAVVKGEGGAIGLTESDSRLRRWMVAGPEICRITTEYKAKLSLLADPSENHHEQIPSVQKAFQNDVSLARVINDLGNPFQEDTEDLYNIDTKVVIADEGVQAVRNAQDIGQTQFEEFMEHKLAGTDAFYETLKKNKLMFFKVGSKSANSSKAKQKEAATKDDLELFSQLYISCQTRGADLDNFFEHENHAWPPSLAENNCDMHHGNKADLLDCIEPFAPRPPDTPNVDVKIFDGAALIHALDPTKSNANVKTFDDYARKVFHPYLVRQFEWVERVDVIWDEYKASSLKAGVRNMRGTGTALHISGNTRVPVNWKNFLRVDSNKRELFRFLTASINDLIIPEGKMIISTNGENVICVPPTEDIDQLQPCTHEEADYRMVLHTAHAHQAGHNSIMIHATDTDVVVLAISAASDLPETELWLAFGHGNNFRYIAAHGIANQLGSVLSKSLLFLHAISGCDTVSSFCGIGKKTAWGVLRSMPHIWSVFRRLSNTPSEITEQDMAEIERFAVVLYKKTSPLSKVNKARKQLFSTGTRKIEKIPPTKAALQEHVKRAAYQAGHVWGQALIPNPVLPSPSD